MRVVEAPSLGESYWEEKLENGLTIRVVPKPGFARKYAFIAVDYGSIDTSFTLNGARLRTPDGVAHYLEHKMFDLKDGDAMGRFAAGGASPNAFTSYDMTAYYFSCTDRFEENFHTLLDMIAEPWFTEASVNKERDIIGQEIRMYEDSPDSKLYENLFSTMFRHHPVRVPIAGTVESIAEITAETLDNCFRTFYAPSNMMLCVVGDVEPTQIVAWTEARLGRDQAPRPVRDYGPKETLDRERSEIREAMEVSMPMFAIGFRCAVPAGGRESMKREFVGDLACELLAGESSALYQNLYEKNLIDSDFSAGFECVKGAGMITFSGDSDAPELVLQAILSECSRMLEQGLDEAAFRRLKKSAMGRRIRDLDSFESICVRMCTNFFDGVDYYDFPSVCEEITLEDVRAFLEETVREERLVLSIIEPKEQN